MSAAVWIGGRPIGPGAPCFVVAEAGVNHDGRLEDALELVAAAARARADAVKFQLFAAERLVVDGAAKAPYQVEATGAGGQRELLRPLELSPAALAAVAERAREEGIVFLATPFDEE